MGERVRLRRSVFARLRFTGVLEFTSLLGVMVVVFLIDDALHGRSQDWGSGPSAALAISFMAASLAVRVAVWTERVEADATHLRWRSLFRQEIVPVERIVKIDVVPMKLFGEKQGSDTLRVHHESGSVRKIRASAWCTRKARNEWMEATARLWGRTAPLR